MEQDPPPSADDEPVNHFKMKVRSTSQRKAFVARAVVGLGHELEEKQRLR